MAATGPPPMKVGRTYVNPKEEDQMEISGYKASAFKTGIVWFFIIITVGLLRLFFYWLPHLFVKATHSKCSLSVATTVLLKNQWNQKFTSKVKVIDNTKVNTDGQTQTRSNNNTNTISETDGNSLRYFICKKVKYIWNWSGEEFSILSGLEKDHTCRYLHQQTGLSNSDKLKRQILYGTNSIRVHVTPIIKILFTQVLSPFYVFQVFSVILWFFEIYYVYATVIVVISSLSIIITIYQTRKVKSGPPMRTVTRRR